MPCPGSHWAQERNRSRLKTHHAASLMSAADRQIPDDTRVVLEDLITETGR